MGSKCCCAKDRKNQTAAKTESQGCNCFGEICGDDSDSSADSGSSSSFSSSSPEESATAFPRPNKAAWTDDDTEASQTGDSITSPLLKKTRKKKRPTEGPWTMEKAEKRAAEEEKREEARDSKKKKIRSALDQAVQAAHAAPSPKTAADLAAAIQKAQGAGLSDREPRVIAAKKIVSEREEAARKALLQAMRSQKFTVLRAAVEEARTMALECEELGDAEAMLLQEKQRLFSSAIVTAPVSNRDIAMLWRRVSNQNISIMRGEDEAELIAPEVAGMENSHREETEAATRARDNLTAQAELAALQEELEEAEARQAQATKGAMAGEQRKVAAMYGLASSALQRDVVKLQDAIKEGFDAGLDAKEMHAAWAVLSAEQKRLQARPSVDGARSSTDPRAPRQDFITGLGAGGSETSFQRDSFGPFSKRGPSFAEQLGPAATSSFAQPPAASIQAISPAAARLIHDDVREVNFGAFRGSSITSTVESSSIDGGSRRSSSVSNRPSLMTSSPEPLRVVSMHEYNPAAVRRASGSRSMPPSHRLSTEWGYDDSKPVHLRALPATGDEEAAQAEAGSGSDAPPSTGEPPRRNSRLLELD
mmetsp:Transcript_42527/g.74667  ORF Transcript_42527/g.74667 Transcript_42527/m.74667 type:complete len:591 (-) Transcript_42527:46-1818(-)